MIGTAALRSPLAGVPLRRRPHRWLSLARFREWGPGSSTEPRDHRGIVSPRGPFEADRRLVWTLWRCCGARPLLGRSPGACNLIAGDLPDQRPSTRRSTACGRSARPRVSRPRGAAAGPRWPGPCGGDRIGQRDVPAHRGREPRLQFSTRHLRRGRDVADHGRGAALSPVMGGLTQRVGPRWPLTSAPHCSPPECC